MKNTEREDLLEYILAVSEGLAYLKCLETIKKTTRSLEKDCESLRGQTSDNASKIGHLRDEIEELATANTDLVTYRQSRAFSLEQQHSDAVHLQGRQADEITSLNAQVVNLQDRLACVEKIREMERKSQALQARQLQHEIVRSAQVPPARDISTRPAQGRAPATPPVAPARRPYNGFSPASMSESEARQPTRLRERARPKAKGKGVLAVRRRSKPRRSARPIGGTPQPQSAFASILGRMG